MNFNPFIQTVEILIDRAKIDQIPLDQDKIILSLTTLTNKYNKLSGMNVTDPVKVQLKKIVNQLMEFDRMIRTTPYKDYWVDQTISFLFNLKSNPLIMPSP